MKYLVAATLIIGMSIGTAQHVVASDRPDDEAQAEVIQEDDPRWDCRTMGNMVCGPHDNTARPAQAVQATPTFTG